MMVRYSYEFQLRSCAAKIQLAHSLHGLLACYPTSLR